MPSFLETLLFLLLFALFLSLLIMIHELGHFTAAKIFKVYVKEFSIGFGPALIHKKPLKGETAFSLRSIPFGGYVALYDDTMQLGEGVVIDKSRSMNGIAKWKRAIILFAGVFMNALLAILIFFIYNVSFSKTHCYYNMVSIKEDSIAYNAGIKTEDIIAVDTYVNEDTSLIQGELHLIDDNSVINLNYGETKDAFTYIDLSLLENYKDESLKFNNFIAVYSAVYVDDVKKPNFNDKIAIGPSFASLDLNIGTLTQGLDNKIIKTNHVLNIFANENAFADFGMSMYKFIQKPLPFFKALGQSFVDFGNSSTLIVRTLGTLFTKNTWENTGGIIALGFQSSSILKNYGFGGFLYLWGAISVNLAIINLLPFPGLDGWQLVVLAVEGISGKKIPDNVKGIVSFIGIGLLFAFMIVLIVKDIFTYII